MQGTGAVKSTLKNWVRSAVAYRDDKVHKRKAQQALEVIEKHNSSKLTPALRTLADDYAHEVLGGREYAPWLYVYAAVSGTFKEGWIPDNYFGKFIVPRVNSGLGPMTEVKSFTGVALRTDRLPDIAYYLNGILYGKTLEPIRIDDLRNAIGEKYEHLFAKKDGSSRGKGVAKLETKQITKEVLDSIGNCVIQYPIEQNAFFEEIVSGSLATVRITTVRNGSGRIEARAAYLRLGRRDTAWVQSDNSIRIAIVDKAGRLDALGYTQDWRSWQSHPDTNVNFQRKCVPCFKEAQEACVSLHASVPHMTIIGWDVAIDRSDQIKIIEWNGQHCDIKFSEATTGPCFADLGWERLRG
jgi:hypothetical protein